MTLHFGKLRRTLASSQKGGFLFVLEPEPIVCEVTWSFIAYVRENYLRLCSQAFVSSNHVCFRVVNSVLAGKQAGTSFKLKMD